MKDKNGTVLPNAEDIAETWRKYLKKMLDKRDSKYSLKSKQQTIKYDTEQHWLRTNKKELTEALHIA